MAEFNIDISKLPEDVREKLAELDLELSEGKNIEIHYRSLPISALDDKHFKINNYQNCLHYLKIDFSYKSYV